MATTDKWKVISMFSALAYTLQLYGFWLFKYYKSAGSADVTAKDVSGLGSVKLPVIPCVHVCRHTHASFTSKRQSLVSSIGKQNVHL